MQIIARLITTITATNVTPTTMSTTALMVIKYL